MAKIGLSYAVFAPVSAYTEGSAITYGTGCVVGGAMTANFSINYANADMYYDNHLGESANYVTGGSVAVTVDELSMENRATILGYTTTSASSTTSYHITNAEAPIGGFGVISEKVKNGVHKYEAKWAHRVQFSQTSDENGTRADSVNFASTTIDGKILAAVVDTGNPRFIEEVEFSTETAAKNWLKSKANIT